jgi:hypothetical protein
VRVPTDRGSIEASVAPPRRDARDRGSA